MTGFQSFSFSHVDAVPVYPQKRIYFLNGRLKSVQHAMSVAKKMNFARAYRAWGLRKAVAWCVDTGKPWQHTKPKLGRRV